MSDFINIHTHQAGAGINIVDSCPGNVPCFGEGKVWCSMGIHPMYIDERVEIRLAEMEEKAENGEIVAIGEAGLDRNSVTPLFLQEKILTRQIVMAECCGLPVIIHCVRAFPELIFLYNKHRRNGAWIIHGFNNNRETLNELLRHGFYISAGKKMMNDRSNIFRFVSDIPVEKLFIETDDSDFPIEEVYRKTAERRGEDVEWLKERIHDNFLKLFTGLRV